MNHPYPQFCPECRKAAYKRYLPRLGYVIEVCNNCEQRRKIKTRNTVALASHWNYMFNNRMTIMQKVMNFFTK